MRLLVLSSLLFVLLLCFSVFSLEGRRHFAKPGKLRFCCRLAPSRNQTTQKGNRMKVCRVCKVKAVAQPWVVPGALPQV
ncbi:protein GPR15L [Dipodomys spectabilis]|uniref:protein GPR15L n=1 Tax=Dipodomys spectabilis TaxID=105255 RepID=UPI001C543E5A|nr:protein GPR15L [Dipodomys spectabilis]XP_042546298.1 protein GPR15L [Dipodomys spectabilis]